MLTRFPSLAYAELRLVLAKVLMTFEMDLETPRWMEGMKTKTLWIKPALMVRLSKAATAGVAVRG